MLVITSKYFWSHGPSSVIDWQLMMINKRLLVALLLISVMEASILACQVLSTWWHHISDRYKMSQLVFEPAHFAMHWKPETQAFSTLQNEPAQKEASLFCNAVSGFQCKHAIVSRLLVWPPTQFITNSYKSVEKYIISHSTFMPGVSWWYSPFVWKYFFLL